MADNKIVIDSSDVEKAKVSLKDLSAQLGVSGNAATEMEGKIASMSKAMQAANAAPFASGFVLVAAALGGAIVAAKGMLDTFVETASGLQRMSAQTGVSVEALSVMSSVAKLSGTSMDTVTGAVIKFEKALGASGNATSLQSKAFKELGIDTSDTSKKTEDYMAMAAEKLNGLQDGWQKNNINMALFGKSGTEVNEFLADYANKGDLAAKITSEQAAQAKEYEVTMKRLSATTNQYKALIGSALLPVATELSEEFLRMTKSVNQLDAGTKELVKSRVADWTFEIAKVIGATVDDFVMLWDVINGTAKAIGVLIGAYVTMGDVINKVAHGDFAGAWEAAKNNAVQLKDGLVDAWSTATQGSTKYYDMVTKAEENFHANQGKHKEEEAKRLANNIGDGSKKDPAKGVDISGEYTKQTDSIIKLSAEYNSLYGVSKQTATQMMQAALDSGKYDAMKRNGVELTKEQVQAEKNILITRAQAEDALTNLIENTKQEVQVRKDAVEIAAKYNQVESNNIAAQIMMQYGKTTTDAAIAVNKYNIAKETQNLISLQAANATKAEIDAATKKLQLLGAESNALDQQKVNEDQNKSAQKQFSYGWEQAFAKYKDDAEDAAKHAQTMFSAASTSMENAIVKFATTGKFSFSDFAASMIQDMIKIAAQKATSGLMSMAMSSFAASANGNVFSGSGILKSADGNVFDSPTIHGYSGGIGMLGEDGPEAVMPLKRDSTGKLGVVSGGGGGGVTQHLNFSHNITVQSTNGNTQDSLEQGRQIQSMIDKQIRASISRESMPGGSLSMAQRRY